MSAPHQRPGTPPSFTLRSQLLIWPPSPCKSLSEPTFPSHSFCAMIIFNINDTRFSRKLNKIQTQRNNFNHHPTPNQQGIREEFCLILPHPDPVTPQGHSLRVCSCAAKPRSWGWSSGHGGPWFALGQEVPSSAHGCWGRSETGGAEMGLAWAWLRK